MQEKTVVLKVYETLHQAQFDKEALELNNIACFLSNQLVSQMYPIFGSSSGGIYLHIFERDAEEATKLLENLHTTPAEGQEREA